jgi:hypothetical protein
MSKQVLELVFANAANKTVHITVPSPKTPVDSAAVGAAMDLVVAKNIFSVNGSDIVKKVEARLTEHTTTAYSF